MGRSLAFLPLSTALVSCGNASSIARLENQYGIMERAGSSASDLCQQGRKIEQLYLEAGDETEYKTQKMHYDVKCELAQYKDRTG